MIDCGFGLLVGLGRISSRGVGSAGIAAGSGWKLGYYKVFLS